MNVLALEASTSSAKAMLYNDRTGVLTAKTVPYTPRTGGPDSHDMDSLFSQLMEVGAQVSSGKNVACIALVGSWHTLVVTDRRCVPLLPSYTWASELGKDVSLSMRSNPQSLQELYHSTGCVPSATYPLYKLMALKKQGFSTENCLVMDETAFLYRCLTGVLKTTKCAASGSSMLNTHSLRWDGSALIHMGITEEQLPPLVHHLETEPLCKEAAALLSLPAGIPVVVPEPDGAMNQLGAGAMRPDTMTLSIGTSAAVRQICNQPFFSPDHSNWCYYAPGTHIIGAATAGSTNCVDWFRRTMGGDRPFEELEQEFCLTEDSPYFLPFVYGERCPGWNDQRTGVFARLAAKHTTHDLYGAVLEGIVHNIYDCYRRLSAAQGEPETVLLSGGILRSAKWSQMLADIFQREITASNVDQVSLLGGAAMALSACGRLRDLTEFSPGDTRYTIHPRASAMELVQKRFMTYRELYLQGEQD